MKSKGLELFGVSGPASSSYPLSASYPAEFELDIYSIYKNKSV